MATFKGWEARLLKALGVPVTKANVVWLDAWQQSEGGGAKFNPLNTTQPAKGATNYNSVGVKDYATAAAGIAATKRTLLNGRYAGIVAALRTGAPQTYVFSNANAQGKTGNPVVSQLDTWGSKSFAAAVQGNLVGPDPSSSADPAVAALTAGGTVQAVAGAASGWLGGLTGWIGNSAAYGLTWLGLVLFAIVLGIVGLMKLVGVSPGAVLRNGAKTAEAAA